MKKVEIYLTGNFDKRFKQGSYAYYLSYKRCVIKRTGIAENIQSKQALLLTALNKALNDMKERCELKIYSRIPLGFNNKKKAIEKRMVYDTIDTINEAGHIALFIDTDDMYNVKIWEDVYGKPNIKKEESTEINQRNNETKTSNSPLPHNKPLNQKPDIGNKNTPNDIFAMDGMKTDGTSIGENSSWKDIYSDLLSDDTKWVPGSGGY